MSKFATVSWNAYIDPWSTSGNEFECRDLVHKDAKYNITSQGHLYLSMYKNDDGFYVRGYEKGDTRHYGRVMIDAVMTLYHPKEGMVFLSFKDGILEWFWVNGDSRIFPFIPG